MSGTGSDGVYVESTIIMTTVRVIAPFVFTFGLFVMFHGAESAGGGFQGGVLVAAAVLLLAFAFGIDATRAWLAGPLTRTAIAGGGAAFALIGVGAIVLDGAFLEYVAYDVGSTGVKYGIELVELGIGAVVSGVLVGLFFSLASGDFTTSTGDAPDNERDAATPGGEEA
ncbi:cation:proton antiporter [Halobellus salinus]|uniref:Cation:proton antiporter n=1 Tax=Halobellus salinus TaxID=931585 RepID=A0A830EPJ9_9EURY|nr:MnhB domain-containing protein [Halobellus salinus]GGJ11359.1 cation:proton antiporter [Halobellus salinus]SMP03680.1 multisubunit sodium/proton antiporter, MrpB subunit [Halobellus salinus]